MFTPWTLLVDAGIISVLLLIGKLIRVKSALVQKFFIPPSLIAGFLGLALGNEGLGILPFSGMLGTYASILIAIIFGCLPFTSGGEKNDSSRQIGKMWAYSQTGMLLQWGIGGLLGLLVLSQVWGVNSAFGLCMPAGFVGGHGSAAALGTAFSKLGFDDMMTLGMTAATVGILGSVLAGLALIKWGTAKGYTVFLNDFDKLPSELRTGLLPKEKRPSMGDSSTSSISIDSLAFNFAILITMALIAYGASQWIASLSDAQWGFKLEMPVFSCAFIFAMLFKFIFRHTGALEYVSPKTIGHISGTCTDYLVAFGISSIKLSVVLDNIIPLLILLVIGLVATLIYVLLVGRFMVREYWFEKSMFTWGWFTGTMAMGIALLRVVDPETRSRCLDDYGLAYIFIAPVEISLITFAPMAFGMGYGVIFSISALVLALAIMLFAAAKGWFRKG